MVSSRSFNRDQRVEAFDLALGQALGRLVQNQEARLLGDAHGDLQEALMAIGEIARDLVGPVGEADAIEHGEHLRLGSLSKGKGDIVEQAEPA